MMNVNGVGQGQTETEDFKQRTGGTVEDVDACDYQYLLPCSNYSISSLLSTPTSLPTTLQNAHRYSHFLTCTLSYFLLVGACLVDG